MPFGFTLAVTLIKFGGNFEKSYLLITVSFCFTVSLIIEIVQAWLPSRSSIMLDLIFNTLGALTGAIILRIFNVGIYRRRTFKTDDWLAFLDHTLIMPLKYAHPTRAIYRHRQWRNERFFNSGSIWFIVYDCFRFYFAEFGYEKQVRSVCKSYGRYLRQSYYFLGLEFNSGIYKYLNRFLQILFICVNHTREAIEQVFRQKFSMYHRHFFWAKTRYRKCFHSD